MRSRADFIHQRMAENLAEGGGNVCDIVLTWLEWPAGSTASPVDGSRSGTPTPRSLTLPGLVHFVQAANPTQVRQHGEIEVGDCIVDFAGDAPLDGKEELRFTIAGRTWLQKQISGRLAQSWDAMVGGRRFSRTLLLQLAP